MKILKVKSVKNNCIFEGASWRNKMSQTRT